jgi:hypothetical protein
MNLSRSVLAALMLAAAAVAVTAGPASAATGFPATADLNGRDGKSLDANVVRVDMYRTGQTVNVVCQDRGDTAYGSSVWDRTTENVWVPDAYVRTGYTGFHPGLPRCSDLGNDGRDFPATTALNGRAAPSLSARVVEVDMYLSGEAVPVVCQATGEAAYGSTVWDRTADGVWVPDAYVRTGYTGFHPDVRRCADAAPSTFAFKAKVDLAGRDRRATSATEKKTYPGGSTIYVVCQAIGANAYGSNIWDRTTDSLWVADHYVKTGYDSFTPGVPRCAADSEDSSGSNGAFPAKVDLAGRDRKSTAGIEKKTYPAGSAVRITCQAYGEYAYGSSIWDRTSDGLWVADFYVRTGTDGFISNMPRCDSDQPSGGGGSGGGTGDGDCAAGHGRIGGAAGPTSGTNAERIARVIAAARTMTGRGLSYSWGAGGKGGPACGSGATSPSGFQDYNVFGFDCSGLTLYAYWKGAGVNIGANTTGQYGVGRRVSYADRAPGDLIFWGENGHTTHVAIYLGDNRMIEAAAPRGTGSVHETTVYSTHRYDLVVRVLG